MKDRDRFGWEDFKALPAKKKLEHIHDYYRWYILGGIVAAVLLVSLIVTIAGNRKEVLISGIFINNSTTAEGYAHLQQGYFDYCGGDGDTRVDLVEARYLDFESGALSQSDAASFMMVASMNPCPCGFYGSKTKKCRCSAKDIRRYLDRISGPLLDRIDIQVEVDAVPVKEISEGGAAESSAEVGARVRKVRELQQARYAQDGIHCNAQLDAGLSKKYCPMTPEATSLLHMAVERMGMSMRAYGRVVKVARTIADMDGADTIGTTHVAEAIQYRELDGKYWKG